MRSNRTLPHALASVVPTLISLPRKTLREAIMGGCCCDLAAAAKAREQGELLVARPAEHPTAKDSPAVDLVMWEVQATDQAN